MSISVIIPVYNSEKTIAQVLDSVRTQTAVDIIKEVIVVNDGSIDGSGEVVARYGVAYPALPLMLINRSNGGVSAARNEGVRASSGQWLAFLDADDLWLPEKIEAQWEAIKAHPEIDFLGCNSNNVPLSILSRKIDTLYRASVKDLCLKSFPSPSCMMVRKSVFEQVGGFEEGVFHMEDAGFCFHVLIGGFGYYQLPVSLVRMDPFKAFYASSGLSSNLKKMHEGEIRYSRELKAKAVISPSFYGFLRVFYFLKYIRRRLLKFLNGQMAKNRSARR